VITGSLRLTRSSESTLAEVLSPYSEAAATTTTTTMYKILCSLRPGLGPVLGIPDALSSVILSHCACPTTS
jgi:hypothetical protein